MIRDEYSGPIVPPVSARDSGMTPSPPKKV